MHKRSLREWLVSGLAVLSILGAPLAASAQTASIKKPAARAASASKKPTAVKPPASRSRQTVSSRTRAARAAAAAKARQAALAREQRDALTPRFKRDLLGNIVPDVRAAAAIVYNPQTGDVLWEANSHDQRSIASLTKIMTAVTFIADDPDLSREVVVMSPDVTRASVTYLRTGDRVTLDNLLHLMLIASDNGAARVLARTSEGGSTAFIDRMNEMATHLGLTSTHYSDPSGLDARNVSSAYDLSHLMAFAGSDPRLGPVLRTAEFNVTTNRRTFMIHSTNKLLGTDVDVRGGKTGFISQAGYCLATLLQVPQGSQVAVVVLGAANSALRFGEARHLFEWAVSRSQGLFPTLAAFEPPAPQ